MNQPSLLGRRVLLRPLRRDDFNQWRSVRENNLDWLTKWEPSRSPNAPDVYGDITAFSLRCQARDREWQAGIGYGFGLFVNGLFIGEINLSSIQRGPFQSCYVGYWVDQRHAGNGYVPESLVLLARYAFEVLILHRIQISIVPRNKASRRVVEKLGIREEGTAQRYLEINGVWEDHVRYAMTSEEWYERREELLDAWI